MNVKKTTADVVKEILSQHPTWTATQVYEEYKTLVPKKEWRGKNAIQKQVQNLRPPEPTLWNTGTRTGNEVSPEAIATIFEIQRTLKKLTSESVKIPNLVAFWIDRLRVAIPDPLTLFAVAWTYADYTLFKQMGVSGHELQEVDTSELDAYLVDKKYEVLIALGQGIHIQLEHHSFEEVKRAFPKLIEIVHKTAQKYEESEK